MSRTRLAPTPTNIWMNSEPRDRKERHARLAGHGPGQQRFAGARRAHQQHALGNAAAQPLELVGVLQELDDFLQVVLDALQAGHVGKRDRLFARFVALGRAFAEARQDAAPHELVAGPAEHHPHAGKQQHGDDHVDDQHQGRAVGLPGGLDLDVLGQQFLVQVLAHQRRKHDAEVEGPVAGFAVARFTVAGFAFARLAVGLFFFLFLFDLVGRKLLELADQLMVGEFDLLDVVGLELLAEIIVADGPGHRRIAGEVQKRDASISTRNNRRRTHSRPPGGATISAWGSPRRSVDPSKLFHDKESKQR